MMLTVKAIETHAYQHLVDEKLLANESFSIFLMMSRNIQDELSN